MTSREENIDLTREVILDEALFVVDADLYILGGLIFGQIWLGNPNQPGRVVTCRRLLQWCDKLRHLIGDLIPSASDAEKWVVKMQMESISFWQKYQ